MSYRIQMTNLCCFCRPLVIWCSTAVHRLSVYVLQNYSEWVISHGRCKLTSLSAVISQGMTKGKGHKAPPACQNGIYFAKWSDGTTPNQKCYMAGHPWEGARHRKLLLTSAILSYSVVNLENASFLYNNPRHCSYLTTQSYGEINK